MDELSPPKFLQRKASKIICGLMLCVILVGVLLPMTTVTELKYWLITSGVFGILLIVAAVLGFKERSWYFAAMMVVAVAVLIYVIFCLILPNI